MTIKNPGLFGKVQKVFGVNPFLTTNFRIFQTERIFKFDENGRQFTKRVGNTLGNGEIAHSSPGWPTNYSAKKFLYARYYRT